MHSLAATILTILSLTIIPAFGQHAIDSAGTIRIGDIHQYVQIKTKDDTKPLFLFLHGGPGNSVIPYGQKFTSELQKHFIVIQWDQRESGQTLALNKSNRPLSISLFETDTRALIDSLLRRFKRPKLYLAGHSWGTVPGFYIATNYPELLYAYIPICPMINQLKSEKIILDIMKQKAVDEKNQKAIAELSKVTVPFGTGEQLYFHRKWLLNYNGSKTILSKSHVTGWSATWLSIFNEASTDDLMETTKVLRCPIYFCVGRNDYQTNSTITEKYYQALQAPKKNLFWFEKSAHSVPTNESQLLQEIIITKILPETYSEN